MTADKKHNQRKSNQGLRWVPGQGVVWQSDIQQDIRAHNAYTEDAEQYWFQADGTEAGAGGLNGVSQGNPTLVNVNGQDVQFQLRVQIAETGGDTSGSSAFSLEYELNDSGTWVAITTTSAAIRVDTGSSLTDGGATTDRITGGTGSNVGGEQEAGDGTTGTVSITAGNHVECVWGLLARDAGIAPGDTIDFRVLADGATFTASMGQPRLQASHDITVPQADLALSTTAPTVFEGEPPVNITVPQGNLTLSTTKPWPRPEPATGWDAGATGAYLNGLNLDRSDGKQLTWGLFFKPDNLDSTAQRVFNDQNGKVQCEIDTTNRHDLFYRDSAFGIQLDASNYADIHAGAWNYVIASIDLDDPTNSHVYRNERNTGYSSLGTGNFDFSSFELALFATPTGSAPFEGEVFFVYLNNDYVDISIEANRRKFVTADGKPNFDGMLEDGSGLTGTVPMIFLAKSVGALEENLGDIGDATVNGTFSEGSTVQIGDRNFEPAVANLTFSTTAPTVQESAPPVDITVPQGDLTLSTSAASQDLGIAGTAGDLLLSLTAPTVQQAFNISVPQGDLALSTAAPSVGEDHSISVPQGDLALSTAAVSLDFGFPLTQGDLALSSTAPEALQAHNISVPQGNLALSSTAPSVVSGASPDITVPQANLTLSTTAPDVIGGSRSFDIPQANLILSTAAPTVQSTASSVVFAPPQANLTLDTREPWVEQPATDVITVFHANLKLTGYAPVVGRGDNAITVPQGNLVLRSDPPLRGGTGFVRASRFDGASDALTISGLTGAVDGTAGTFSCAIRRQPPALNNRTFEPPHADMALIATTPELIDSSVGNILKTIPTADLLLSTTSPTVLTSVDIGAQTLFYIGTGQDFGLKIEILQDGLIRAIARQVDNTVVFTCTSGNYRIPRDGIAKHLHIHWSGTTCTIKVSGTDVSDNTAGTAGNIDYTEKVTIGASDDSSQPNRLNADLGVIFFDDAEITDSERFRHSPSGQFRWIGSDGSGAGTATPLVYLNSDYLNLGLNNGSGGNFTTEGGLEEATDFGAFTDSVVIEPPQADLALSTTAPDLEAGLPIPSADLVLSTTAPSVVQAHNATVPQADLVLSTTAPSAVDSGSGAKDITVPQGDLALSTTAPVRLQEDSRDPGTADLALSTTAPSALQAHNVSVPQADLTLTGGAGTAITNIIISVPSADLTLSTTAPTMIEAHEAPIPAADLTLSTAAPVRLQNEARAPPQADLVLSATAVQLDFGFTVPQADLALSTTAPTVGGDHTVTVPQANLTLSTTAPIVSGTTQTVISPPTADLVLSTTAPTVSVPTVGLLEVASPGATAVFGSERTEAVFQPEKTEAIFH